MDQGRIIIITGAPGTGKTAVSSLIAKNSSLEKSIHLHTDDFYRSLCKGAIPPWLPQAEEQNAVVIESFLAAAKRYVQGGYDVIVDGVVGPWFLQPWLDLARQNCEIHYIILRAAKEETLKRALGRSKLTRERNAELVETMWDQFNRLGFYESYVLDTTRDSAEKTALLAKEKIAEKTNLLL